MGKAVLVLEFITGRSIVTLFCLCFFLFNVSINVITCQVARFPDCDVLKLKIEITDVLCFSNSVLFARSDTYLYKVNIKFPSSSTIAKLRARI